MEDDPLRVPYIEGEIWGNSPRAKLKEGMSSKINFAQFLRGPLTSRSRRFIKVPLNTPSEYQSDLRYPQKESIHAMCLVRRSARSVLWVDEETLASIGKQDSTSHDVGSRTSKSSSLSEDLDSRILRGYCGARSEERRVGKECLE